MQLATKARAVLAGVALMGALAGTGVAAAPAIAANWKNPKQYPLSLLSRVQYAHERV